MSDDRQKRRAEYVQMGMLAGMDGKEAVRHADKLLSTTQLDTNTLADRLAKIPREAWTEAMDSNDEAVAWRAIAAQLLGVEP